jgi:hypothetical protein
MVWGERAIGDGVVTIWGGSRTGCLLGDLFELLGEPPEDIDVQGWVRGGTERIASCRCSW